MNPSYPTGPTSPDAEIPRHQRVVEAFRTGSKNRELPPREKFILGIVAVHLGFLAWAFGGRNFWAQYISLGLAVAGFVVALLPREIPRTVDQPGMRLMPWFALQRSWLFWGGGLILALVVVQGLNPSWSFRQGPSSWWMTRIDYIRWLPHGVETPWARPAGPWHTLIVWTAAWLTACTVRIGLTRRRALRILLVTVVANGVGIVLLGLVERLFGNGKIYWTVPSPNPSFFASFVYKNHAGTWLNLCLGAAIGLAGWYYLRGLRRMEKSNPSGVLLFVSTLFAVSIFLSLARGATLMMLVFLSLAIAAFLIHQLYVPKTLRRPVVGIILFVLFVGFLKTGLDTLKAEEAWGHLNDAFTETSASLRERELLTKASLLMLDGHGPWGTGAGSFRYLFSSYQKLVPGLWTPSSGNRLYWEHAHNDIVEFTLELGVPGMLVVLGMIGAGVVALVRNYFWENAVCVALVLTLLLTAVHAWWEFVFQNTAILVLYCTLCVVAVQWARFEEGG